MDGDEAKETAADDVARETTSMSLEVSSSHEPKKQPKRKRASSELPSDEKGEIGALFDYYKEVSGYQLNPEEVGCSTNDSIIACLLEESSLPHDKLVDEIYKRMELRQGVTKSLISSSVDNIGQRKSYGISDVHANVLEDESESKLWCWETRDLKLLPSQHHWSLENRRKARNLIHERIMAISGNPKSHVGQNTGSVNAGRNVQSLDGIRSFLDKLKTDMAQKDSKTNETSTMTASKEQKKIDREVQKDQKQKEKELKRIKEQAEKEAKRAEREKDKQDKLLKKHQKEVEREQKRREKERAELKMQASIQKGANFMKNFLRGKMRSSVESPDNFLSMRSSHSNIFSKIEHRVAPATSEMDCALDQENHLPLHEIRKLHITGWRKISLQSKSCQWGIRRNPKIQLFKELKLKISPPTEPSEYISTLIEEESSQMGNPGRQLLDEWKKPCDENNDTSITTDGNKSSSVSSVRKLLQFDKSHRPAYYGTWTNKSSTVGPRHPFKVDPDLDYEVDSDEEWEEEEPGENLSDFDDDEEAMDEKDSMVDTEGETDNSFIVPNGYLSEDEGVEPLSRKLDETIRLLRIPGVSIGELDVILQQQKALGKYTKHALEKDRPLLISNLDHGKADLLDAEDILKVEQRCLQALSMREYPGGPSIEVPVNIEDQEIGRPDKKRPSTPVASKSISDSDMPEFVNLVSSCPHKMVELVESLHVQFPHVPKLQLKKKIKEIAKFTNNRWQVKEAILDLYGSSRLPDKDVQKM